MPQVRHPIVFTGHAQSYQLVWRRNLWLLAVSLLFAWPWTYVRKLQYLYSHTSIGGHALSYHADPKKIFISNLYGIFFIEALYYGIYKSGVYAWTLLALAQIVFAALMPFVLHKNLAFRLRHTEWQGQRFHLDAKPADAWHAMCVPTFLYILSAILLVVCVLTANADQFWLAWGSGLLSLAGFCGCLPLQYVQFCRYRQRHATWAGLRNEVPLDVNHTRSLWLSAKAGTCAFLACLLLAVPATYLLQRWTGWSILETGAAIRSQWTSILMLLALFIPALYLGVCGLMAASYPYIGAQLQNQCWSQVACPALRVESNVPVAKLMRVSLRNWWRVLITGGWYYPQAFMAEAKIRLEAVTVWLDQDLIDAALAKAGQRQEASQPQQVPMSAPAEEVLAQAAMNFTVKP